MEKYYESNETNINRENMNDVERTVKGVVRFVRKTRDGYSFTLFTKSTPLKLYSRFYVEEGKAILGKLRGEVLEDLKEIGFEELRNEFKEHLESTIVKPTSFYANSLNSLNSSQALSFLNQIIEIGKELMLFSKLGFDIVVRYNADADGISSAIQLKEFMKANFISNPSPFYLKRDALNDLTFSLHKFNPVLILLDFSSNKESIESLEIASSYARVFIIDHHPFDESFSEFIEKKPINFLNPHSFSLGSEITTGYICFEIARLFGKEREKWMRISLAGDKSNLININEKDKEDALVFDYLAFYSPNTPLNFFKEVLEKEDIKETFLIQAKEKIESFYSKLSSLIPVKIGDIELYLIDLSSLNKFDFPNASKVVTLLKELKSNSPGVFIGYTESSLIFRVNDKAFEIGVDANSLIKALKEKFKEKIISGGGHKKASSLKLSKDFSTKLVIEEIKEMLKEVGVKEKQLKKNEKN